LDKRKIVLEIIKAYRISYAELGLHMKKRRSQNGNDHLSKRHVYDILKGCSSFENYQDQFIPALNAVLEERGLQDRIPETIFDEKVHRCEPPVL